MKREVYICKCGNPTFQLKGNMIECYKCGLNYVLLVESVNIETPDTFNRRTKQLRNRKWGKVN